MFRFLIQKGHDTTGANIEWVCLMLACNPECQVSGFILLSEEI